MPFGVWTLVETELWGERSQGMMLLCKCRKDYLDEMHSFRSGTRVLVKAIVRVGVGPWVASYGKGSVHCFQRTLVPCLSRCHRMARTRLSLATGFHESRNRFPSMRKTVKRFGVELAWFCPDCNLRTLMRISHS